MGGQEGKRKPLEEFPKKSASMPSSRLCAIVAVTVAWALLPEMLQ